MTGLLYSPNSKSRSPGGRTERSWSTDINAGLGFQARRRHRFSPSPEALMCLALAADAAIVPHFIGGIFDYSCYHIAGGLFQLQLSKLLLKCCLFGFPNGRSPVRSNAFDEPRERDGHEDSQPQQVAGRKAEHGTILLRILRHGG